MYILNLMLLYTFISIYTAIYLKAYNIFLKNIFFYVNNCYYRFYSHGKKNKYNKILNFSFFLKKEKNYHNNFSQFLIK